MKRVISILSVLCVVCCFSVSALAVNDYTVTAEDTTGLKAILLNLLGDYTPTVVEVTDTDSSGNTTTSLEVKNDYVWLASFAMFALVIYCVFRLGGSLINDI